MIFRIFVKGHGTAQPEWAMLHVTTIARQCIPQLNISPDSGEEGAWAVATNLQQCPDFYLLVPIEPAALFFISFLHFCLREEHFTKNTYTYQGHECPDLLYIITLQFSECPHDNKHYSNMCAPIT